MAKLETLTDDFSIADGSKWNGYSSFITVAGGQLSIVPDATYNRYVYTPITYDLASSYIQFEVVSLGSATTLMIQLLYNSAYSNVIDMLVEGGQLKFREAVGGTYSAGTPVTWDATAHRWWRIREDAGTIYWETSPDATIVTPVWTVRRSKAKGFSDISLMAVAITAYTASGTTPALIDNVNPVPPAPPVTPPAVTATPGVFKLEVDTLTPQYMYTQRNSDLVLLSGGPPIADVVTPPPGPGDPPPVQPAYAITGTTYYVGVGGNDSSAGTSHATRWATWNRAMQQNYTAGDGLLFERGGTYQINAINKVPAAKGAERWIIGSYGTGALPIHSHYKICNIRSAWTLHSAGIWKIQLGLASTHTGMTEVPARVAFGRESNTNIGYIYTDGTIRGAKKTSIAACTTQWDFFGDTTGDWFYIKSSAHPLDLCSDFRAAPDGRLIQMQHNMEVADMEFTGCGGIVWSGSGSSPHNCRVLRNTIRNVGGSFLIGFGNPPYTTRWGDAIEIWGGSYDYHFTGNTVIGSFDPAIVAAQGTGNISNILISDNNIYSSAIAFELSIKNGNWDNIILERNRAYDSGVGGWASALQPNLDRNCALILMDLDPAHGTSTNIHFRNNYIERASQYIMTWPIYDPPLPAGVSFTNNDIRMASGKLMQFGKSETINTAAAYRTRTGREVGSVFTVL